MRRSGWAWCIGAFLLSAASANGQQPADLPEVYAAGPPDQVERLELYRQLDLPAHFREYLARLIADRNQLYRTRDEKVELMFQEFYQENAALNPAGLARQIDEVDAALTSFDEDALRVRNETVWALKLESLGGDIRSREMRRKYAGARFKYHAAMVEWDAANPGAPVEGNRIAGRQFALDLVIGSWLYQQGRKVDAIDYGSLFRLRPLPYPEAVIPAEFQADYQEHQTLYEELMRPEANAALIACLNDRFNRTNQQQEVALYDQLEAAEEEVASLDIEIRRKSDELAGMSIEADMEAYLARKRELTELRQNRSNKLWGGRRVQVAIWGTEVFRSARRAFRELHDTECDAATGAKLDRFAGINFKARIREAYPALDDVPLPVTYNITHRGARLTAAGFGTMEIAFLADEAPAHVENFIKLVRSGFYDGTTFHRVVKGFVVQGGDPNTKDDNPNNDGVGDPGYRQTIELGPSKNLRGYIGAAQFGGVLQDRSGPRQDAGSQFYILLADSQHLDREGTRSTIFARVVNGMDVLERIGNAEVDPKMRPLEDIRVTFSLVE